MKNIEISIVVLFSVLILSIFTLFACRKDQKRIASRAEFLFRGKHAVHSLASSIGSIFSLSVFFGGAAIYGGIYKGWFLIVSILGVICVAIVQMYFLKNLVSSDRSPQVHQHLLLTSIANILGRKEARQIGYGLTVIYAFLLISEISLGRLLFSTIVPESGLVGPIALALVLVISYLYVVFGGYRAVLNSDVAQTIVLVVFLGIIITTIYSSTFDLSIGYLFNFPIIDSIGKTILAMVSTLFLIIGVGISSIEIYSRMNYEKPNRNKTIGQYILVSNLMSVLLLVLGAVFGQVFFSSEYYPEDFTTEAAAQGVIDFIIADHGLLLISMLTATLVCALFTTVDTIILSLVQIIHSLIGQQAVDKFFPLIFSLGVITAALIPDQHITPVWVVTASLFIPIAPLVSSVFLNSDNLKTQAIIPLVYYSVALVVIGNIVLYPFIYNSYQLHLSIPFIAFFSTILVFGWFYFKKTFRNIL